MIPKSPIAAAARLRLRLRRPGCGLAVVFLATWLAAAMFLPSPCGASMLAGGAAEALQVGSGSGSGSSGRVDLGEVNGGDPREVDDEQRHHQRDLRGNSNVFVQKNTETNVFESNEKVEDLRRPGPRPSRARARRNRRRCLTRGRCKRCKTRKLCRKAKNNKNPKCGWRKRPGRERGKCVVRKLGPVPTPKPMGGAGPTPDFEGATRSPTDDPTRSPTDDPTHSPTKEFISQGEDDPTSRPSEDPSPNPSEDPSPSPSEDPSPSPSEDPSSSPSKDPTAAPSELPSASPSGHPTSVPSAVPSRDPSSSPLGDPTSSPSEDPSSGPSEDPSSIPSDDPSSSPSKDLTSEPTSELSSMNPSLIPSLKPTHAPSAGSFSTPSSPPSLQPTTTSQPSWLSDFSSAVPNLSSVPSVSLKPSAGPTVRRSDEPSAEPSVRPRSDPSITPSSEPSTIPTASSEPTSQPTADCLEELEKCAPGNDQCCDGLVCMTMILAQGPMCQDISTARSFETPTTSPSSAPSQVPSTSQAPSQNPILAPSVLPSTNQAPSQNPTSVPSVLPSSEPSTSQAPRQEPSLEPSTSQAPTVFPTSEPPFITQVPTKNNQVADIHICGGINITAVYFEFDKLIRNPNPFQQDEGDSAMVLHQEGYVSYIRSLVTNTTHKAMINSSVIVEIISTHGTHPDFARNGTLSPAAQSPSVFHPGFGQGHRELNIIEKDGIEYAKLEPYEDEFGVVHRALEDGRELVTTTCLEGIVEMLVGVVGVITGFLGVGAAAESIAKEVANAVFGAAFEIISVAAQQARILQGAASIWTKARAAVDVFGTVYNILGFSALVSIIFSHLSWWEAIIAAVTIPATIAAWVATGFAALIGSLVLEAVAIATFVDDIFSLVEDCEVPTTSPTSAPSQVPSTGQAPSQNPTLAPSVLPSSEPSTSQAPSQEPSLEPSTSQAPFVFSTSERSFITQVPTKNNQVADIHICGGINITAVHLEFDKLIRDPNPSQQDKDDSAMVLHQEGYVSYIQSLVTNTTHKAMINSSVIVDIISTHGTHPDFARNGTLSPAAQSPSVFHPGFGQGHRELNIIEKDGIEYVKLEPYEDEFGVVHRALEDGRELVTTTCVVAIGEMLVGVVGVITGLLGVGAAADSIGSEVANVLGANIEIISVAVQQARTLQGAASIWTKAWTAVKVFSTVYRVIGFSALVSIIFSHLTWWEAIVMGVTIPATLAAWVATGFTALVGSLVLEAIAIENLVVDIIDVGNVC